MRRHHFIPATFLASFSEDTTTMPRRSRLLAFGNKENGRIVTTTANNLAAINNLYTLADTSGDPEDIDAIWWEYERNLNAALNQLISGRIDASTWARILVPFAAAPLTCSQSPRPVMPSLSYLATRALSHS